MNGSASRHIRIARAGLLSTVQDLGRHGFGHLGVSPAGAADTFAARAANRLVGNPDGFALIETTVNGAEIEVRCAARAAVTGAAAPIFVDDARVPGWQTLQLRSGQTLRIGGATAGIRSYVAFDGGIAVTPVLGSASTDVVGGIGGKALRTDDELALAEPPGDAPFSSLTYDAEAASRYSVSLAEPQVLHVMRLKGQTGVNDAAWNVLVSSAYRATVRSSRQALRLDGAALPGQDASAVSSGVCAGCVQVTADGVPLVLLCEHQTTGGYVIAGCVVAADLSRAAQLGPGDSMRFAETDYPTAARLAAAVELQLRALRPVGA